jgi:hypothetical protein
MARVELASRIVPDKYSTSLARLVLDRKTINGQKSCGLSS